MARLSPVTAQSALREAELQIAGYKIESDIALETWQGCLDSLRSLTLALPPPSHKSRFSPSFTPNTDTRQLDVKKLSSGLYRIRESDVHIMSSDDAVAIGFRGTAGVVHAIKIPRSESEEPTYALWGINDSRAPVDNLHKPVLITARTSAENMFLSADITDPERPINIANAVGHMFMALHQATEKPVGVHEPTRMELDRMSFTVQCLGLVCSELPEFKKAIFESPTTPESAPHPEDPLQELAYAINREPVFATV
jgi:hypothetical protein